MKYLLILLLTVVNAQVILAQSSDEISIRQVIEAESKAYHHSADRASFLSYWHINQDTRMVYSGLEGQAFITGDMMKAAIASGQFAPPDFVVNEYTNFVIKTSGNVAWASFDQKSTAPDGKSTYMHEFRGLEKIDHVWKIVTSSVNQYKP